MKLLTGSSSRRDKVRIGIAITIATVLLISIVLVATLVPARNKSGGGSSSSPASTTTTTTTTDCHPSSPTSLSKKCAPPPLPPRRRSPTFTTSYKPKETPTPSATSTNVPSITTEYVSNPTQHPSRTMKPTAGGTITTTTTTPTGTTPACRVCGYGFEIGSPGNLVHDPYYFSFDFSDAASTSSDDRITCKEMEDRATRGLYDTIQCNLVKSTVSRSCQCRPSSGSSSTNVPSIFPLQPEITEQPTQDVRIPSIAPSGAPYDSPSESPSSTKIVTKTPTTKLPTIAPQSVETDAPTAEPTAPSPTAAPSRMPTTPSQAYYPGKLTVRENGIILSQGLTSRVFARAGSKVKYADGNTSTIDAHSKPDFGGVFEDLRPENEGGYIYVSNSEVKSAGKGGVGAFTFNKDGDVIDYRMVLRGTKTNCGGGTTPWGAWISCEEHDQGRNWQVDPIGQREPAVITLGNDGGEFESFAFDITSKNSPQFFVTEDEDDGAMQRFRPDNPNWNDPWSILLGSGVTDFLVLRPDNGTYFFTQDRAMAKSNAEQYYRGSEGIDCVGGILYFVSKKKKTLFILNLNDDTYTSHSTERGAFDAQPDQVARVIGTNDLLFFTEDGKDRPGIHARNKNGAFFTILEGLDVEKDESTGLAFSPDGMHLYFAMQDVGMIFDVTRIDGLPFHAKALNIKYHSLGDEAQ